MLITELKNKDVIKSLVKGKVFALVCHGCKEIRFPEAETDELLKELAEEGVVTGKYIPEPKNFVVRVGTSAAALVEACGGISGEDVLIKAGGPMMGFPQTTLDTPIMKGSNGIIAIDNDEPEVQECIKCGRCVDVCPMELKPLHYFKLVGAQDWQGCKDMKIMDCMECRCCEYICSSKLPLVTMIKMGKNGVRGLK